MRKQGGFTLIELVVVIVILGILAVTAAPKFLNFQDDAKKAALQGLKGAIDGASSVVYGKAAIEGVTSNDSATDVDGISTIFGYPVATSAGIGSAVTGLSQDWDSNTSGAVGTIKYSFKGNTKWTNSSKCFVEYTQPATSSAVATTVLHADNC